MTPERDVTSKCPRCGVVEYSPHSCATPQTSSWSPSNQTATVVQQVRAAEILSRTPSAVAAPDVGHVLAARKLWRKFRELEQDCHGDAQEAFIRIVAPILARTESAIGTTIAAVLDIIDKRIATMVADNDVEGSEGWKQGYRRHGEDFWFSELEELRGIRRQVDGLVRRSDSGSEDK